MANAKLHAQWAGLWYAKGFSEPHTDIFNALVDRYSEPHRAYHGLNHVSDCLDYLPLAVAFGVDGNAEAIEMALWFHDAVYDPRAKDNEEQSALLANTMLSPYAFNVSFIRDVQRLILITKHAVAPKQDDERAIVDIDLAVLGRDRTAFQEYEHQIRTEYSWVPEEVFRPARAKILRTFLQRNSIYSTPFFKERYEKPARENLQWSIEQLERFS